LPRILTQYRVFIGSPGGLEPERKAFRIKLNNFNSANADEFRILFEPVCWEETLRGAGRPQALIDRDLEECDYAVFILHDRWGTPPSDENAEFTAATEEEWNLALKLYEESKMKNVTLFFKNVDDRQRNDAGPQLSKVLAFRKQIEKEKKHFFGVYDDSEHFARTLDLHLARWLKNHLDDPGVRRP